MLDEDGLKINSLPGQGESWGEVHLNSRPYIVPPLAGRRYFRASFLVNKAAPGP